MNVDTGTVLCRVNPLMSGKPAMRRMRRTCWMGASRDAPRHVEQSVILLVTALEGIPGRHMGVTGRSALAEYASARSRRSRPLVAKSGRTRGGLLNATDGIYGYPSPQ